MVLCSINMLYLILGIGFAWSLVEDNAAYGVSLFIIPQLSKVFSYKKTMVLI